MAAQVDGKDRPCCTHRRCDHVPVVSGLAGCGQEHQRRLSGFWPCPHPHSESEPAHVEDLVCRHLVKIPRPGVRSSGGVEPGRKTNQIPAEPDLPAWRSSYAVACGRDHSDDDAVEPRVSLITLGVADLERSYRFYRDGLGLPTTRGPDQGIVFFQTSGAVLALFPFGDLAEDVGAGWNVPRSKFTGITLAHNVRERSEVDEVLALAAAAGAQIVKPACETSWGGYSGYFSDPDGYLWEVAWGAFDFNMDGSLKVT